MTRQQPRVLGEQSDQGQSLVEFALILPILLILMLGLLDFGRAVASYNAVSNGARSGARVAIIDQNEEVVREAVQSEAVGASDVDVQFNWNVEGETGCPSIGCVIEVRASTTYTPATPIIGNLVGNFTISSSSRMPIERVYVSP